MGDEPVSLDELSSMSSISGTWAFSHACANCCHQRQLVLKLLRENFLTDLQSKVLRMCMGPNSNFPLTRGSFGFLQWLDYPHFTQDACSPFQKTACSPFPAWKAITLGR